MTCEFLSLWVQSLWFTMQPICTAKKKIKKNTKKLLFLFFCVTLNGSLLGAHLLCHAAKLNGKPHPAGCQMPYLALRSS